MASDGTVLKVRGLGKRFGGHEVLIDVSFDLRIGEILGVIGPSGGGKTTLLKCLDLLERPSSGSVRYFDRISVSVSGNGDVVYSDGDDDEEFLSEDKAAQLRQNIGLVFQGFNLWEEKSVLANLTLAPQVVGKEEREEAERRARDICIQFGLHRQLHSKAWQLSGGQRQRVAIIRALMMEPRAILLDEITSALDPVLTLEVMGAIKRLRDEGLAMIVVTHHIGFASSLCDRIMFLSEGRIAQIDTPDRLAESPGTPEVSRFLKVLEAAR